ncbi:MAG TPA: type II 3-dehydroquinate dehydratase [candidate division Zixibacteria bacterium]|nr:type II 3-dehydroquinate dehydratase [candidate division Zixibacteria bacterium]
MPHILIINGPNLNLLGKRERETYGETTLEEITASLSARAAELNVTVDCFQSNSEGALIDCIQGAPGVSDGIIINPGGLTHSSVSLRDALLGVDLPFIEVHISNIYAREEFRTHSVIADVALGQISGLGPRGYLYALDSLVAYLTTRT